MAHKVAVLGAGRVGLLIAYLLASESDYKLIVVDPSPISINPAFSDTISHVALSVEQADEMHTLIEQEKISTLVCALPYQLNLIAAQLADDHGLIYFNLSEDVAITKAIKALSANSKATFVPQCGLAPGFITIASYHLMQQFDAPQKVEARVGALPQNRDLPLGYGITWSEEGLINEYIQDCEIIQGGQLSTALGLDGLERLVINEEDYEAFYTSGGIGSLLNMAPPSVESMDYKTLRYPGHCQAMRFLLQNLNLQAKPELMIALLKHALEPTLEDCVMIVAKVTGLKNNQTHSAEFLGRYLPYQNWGETFTALQMTTASSLCVVLDWVLSMDSIPKGFLVQEEIGLERFMHNRFGQYYNTENQFFNMKLNQGV